MSIVKFGNKRYGRFLWGQPNSFYIYENLFKYLPYFVNQKSNFLKGLLKAVAIVLLEWHRAVYTLKTYHLTGFAGLKYLNESWKIFITSKTNDTELLKLIHQVYYIHTSRGTATGILQDLKRITGDDGAAIEYFGQEQCGWWVNITYPDWSPDLQLGNSYNTVSSYVNLENMLFLKYYNYSAFRDEILAKTILKEIIPVAINISQIILKPTVIKFGRFRMGLKKFGQLINPR